ncbi:MAG: DNA helicase UvrD [Parcubacteria group bacterium QH_9_35_7]|nr:MAG: DNA helicase UvrD [Parcubacteria group bacterium QH_9_35_7]
MVKQILDLHIHSKYSRACSKRLTLPKIAESARKRGIDIVSTADFTHPEWFAHIKENLTQWNPGIYKLKDNKTELKKYKKNTSETKFILGTELSVIQKHKGKTRKVHHCVFVPNLETTLKLNRELENRDFNLSSNGRPILGLTSKELLELLLEVDERIVMIPAHAWTPWFGIFGSKSGYDSLENAFGDLYRHIPAIETGLSSDPPMNWRCSWLDDITLVSNSDAHSPEKLGREANVLEFSNEEEITFEEIFRIIEKADRKKFKKTIEFYPEEGKYHYNGHRDCDLRLSPQEVKESGEICPECDKKLTLGVMHRVVELGDRSQKETQQVAEEKNFIPYQSLIPLPEILSEVHDVGVKTKTVNSAYEKMINKLGPEFDILMDFELKKIAKVAGNRTAEAIRRVRAEELTIKPGYDGKYGKIKIFSEQENDKQIQLSL